MRDFVDVAVDYALAGVAVVAMIGLIVTHGVLMAPGAVLAPREEAERE